MMDVGIELADVPDAAVNTIKKALPQLGQCKVYEGEFDGDRRVSIAPPSVFIAALGGETQNPGTDQVDLRCRFAAYVVAEHAGRLGDRQRGAMALAQQVALLIHTNQWGLAGLEPARLLRIENASSTVIQERALALWIIQWEHPLRLGDNDWLDDGTPPDEVFLGINPEEFPRDYDKQETDA